MHEPGWQLPPSGGARALFGAFVGAVVIEAAAVVSVVAWVNAAPVPPAIDKAPMKISLVTLPPAPPAPAPVAPTPDPPKPPPQDPPPQPPPPQPQPPPPPQPQPAPAPPPPAPAPPPPKPVLPPPPPPKPAPKPRKRVLHPVKPVTNAPADHTAHVVPPVQSPPSAPAAAPAASPDVIALFEGQVRLAVQRAVVYPMGARMAREAGKAQVAFTLQNGAAAGVSVVHSSGFPMLDNAALAAVRAAHYPAPPAALQGRTMHLVVWVLFRAPDDD